MMSKIKRKGRNLKKKLIHLNPMEEDNNLLKVLSLNKVQDNLWSNWESEGRKKKKKKIYDKIHYFTNPELNSSNSKDK